MTTTPPAISEAEAGGSPVTETARVKQRPSRRRYRAPGFGQPLLEAGGVGAIAIGLAVLITRAWRTGFGSTTVSVDNSDAQLMAVIVKGIQDHGWYLQNPNLGAPFGQRFYDYPQAGETLQLGVIRFLALFSRQPYLVMNVYYLLGFGILAAVTYLVLRELRFRQPIAVTVAMLYTFLPYHFAREEMHLFLSAYFSAPIGALLILWVLTWRTSFLHDATRQMRNWAQLRENLRWKRVAAAGLLAGVVATTYTYTTAFVLVTLAVACAVIALRDRDWGVLAAGGAAIVIIGVVFVAALAPSLSYWRQHGDNKVAARRFVTQQEIYGLKISQLVLPNANSRIKALRDVQQRTQAGSRIPITHEGGQTLGFIGAIGFICLLWGALRYALRAGPLSRVDDRKTLWGHSGLLALISVLFGAVSGFGLELALLGFSQIRGWDRIVVLIAFFAMVVVAIGLERIIDWLRPHLPSRRAAAMATTALLLLVAGFGIWDTATPSPQPQRAATVAQAQTLQTFTAALGRQLPPGAALFQLPIMRFPDATGAANGPMNKMVDYDEALPYLYSHNYLRWSYGGIKGRPSVDWQLKVNSFNPIPSLAGIRGLGFDGIVVDIYGYQDGARAVSSLLTQVLGQPEVVSPNGGRWRFWNLRDFAQRANLTTAQLRRYATSLVGPKLIRSVPVTKGIDA